MRDWNEYNDCFACGRNNPIGLRLEYTYENDTAIASFVLNPVFDGFPGIIHGGIVSTVLDESMAKAILHSSKEAVTARMTVDFKQPLNSGTTYTARGWVLEVRGRRITARSEIRNPEGNVCASAEGIWLEKRLTGSETSAQ
jgi:uncharacterized protein (TIGR00369 family)